MTMETLAMFGMGDLRVAKLEVEWKWNKEKEKKHYRLFLTNSDEFKDINPTPYNKSSKDLSTEFIPLETNIKAFLNELGTTKYELEENYEQWSMTDDANEIRTLLSQSEKKLKLLGLEENRGIETYSISDIKKLWNNCNRKVALMIYLKKAIKLHYIFYCKLQHNGFFKEYNPDNTDISANNIWKIKRWLENLK